MNVMRDVATFARIQAELRRPFARREEILRAAGLDDAGLARAEKHWAERLAEPGAAPLRDAFRAAWRGEPAAEPAPVDRSGEEPTQASDDEQPRASTGTAASGSVQEGQRLVPSYLREPAVIAESRAVAPADAGPDSTLLPVQRSERTLPFAPATPGIVPEAVEALKGAARREPPAPRADGDETAFLPASAMRDALSLPFEAAGPPPGALPPDALPPEAPPHFSLEEYARFLVAFASSGEADVEQLRSRFGIASADMQRAIGAAFAARFARDPAARAAFDSILADLRRGAR